MIQSQRMLNTWVLIRRPHPLHVSREADVNGGVLYSADEICVPLVGSDTFVNEEE